MQETELTNRIYELLSPKENPERGRLYLELFDKHILRLNMTEAELDSAEVYGKVINGKNEQYRTKRISASRPIDLVIITNKRFIPIEVKIGDDFGDQDNQCRDYWLEAKKYHEEYSFSEPPVLYYLTPEGDFPEINSAKNLGYDDYPFFRSDKIDDVAFCSEVFSWIADCEDNPPKNIFQKNNLECVYNEISEMIKSTDSQRQVEGIMHKFFTTLDKMFDEDFCKKYHLKRGDSKRMEIGDCYTYKRYIDRFFGRAFSWSSICLQCADVKLDDDKELWFRVGCYNGAYNELGESTALCAGFMIFSNEIKEGLYKESDIKQLLGGRNILPQEIVDEYDKKFNGLVGRIDLHDEQGNLIYFTDVYKTLAQFRTQEDIDRAVENIMTEIEAILRRFVYG